MKNLKILDLYSNSSEKQVDNFPGSLSSSLEVKHKFDEYIYDDEWLGKIEDTLKYIDNILRNPNRFIINEEEVVKIELARKITVESIKHLSKNTSFIQDINEKTGDVKPSKILNINKEESFNTYENRFIYSLIRNIEMYIHLRKQSMNSDFASKSDKQMQYTGNTRLGSENINISINFQAQKDNGEKSLKYMNNLADRIKKIEMQLGDIKRSELYTKLSKIGGSLVTSPIKKTNMILKNTNFKAAVELWNYLQTHVDDNSKKRSGDEVIKDDPALKEFIDEVFMINYLVADSIDNKEGPSDKKAAASEFLVNNFVQKIIATNNEITKDDLTKMVENQFIFIKNQTLTKGAEIKKIFKMAIDEYEDSIKKIELKGDK